MFPSSRRRTIALAVSLAMTAPGCRAKHEGPPPASESVAPSAPVAVPAGLLLEGALRRPSEVWQHLRSLVGGKAALLPSSFGLSVTTLIGASPLAAGLVDETGTLPIVFVDTPRGAGFVVGVHLTSGAELTVALANGADARFVAEPDVAHGLTLFKRAPVAHPAPPVSEEPVTAGIAGDYLLLGPSAEHLRVGGAYAARTLSRSLGEGPPLSLTAPKAALAGALATSLRARFAELRESLQVSDLSTRARHGGRVPDFGDPAAVISALTAAFADVVGVVESADALRFSAALLDASPSARLEVVPAPSGAAHDFVVKLPTGSVEPLLVLPDWTQTAVLWQTATADATPPLGDRTGAGAQSRWGALFGERLRPAERDKLDRFGADVERGLGSTALAGLFGSGTQLGLFLVGENAGGHAGAGGPPGDADADSLARATDALAEIAAIPAVSAPMRAALGDVQVRRADGVVPGVGKVARVVVRIGAPAGAAKAPPIGAEVVAARRGARAAVVLSSGDAGGHLAELLAPEQASPIGKDAVVARAALRAGTQAAYALVSRIEDGSGNGANGSTRGVVVVTVGSDRKVAWAEMGLSDAALAALVSAGLAR